MFREAHPGIEIRETLFAIDRNRVTCAGGIATLDMMLHLIASKHGRALAEVVANGFVHGRIRHDNDRQRVSADDAFSLVNHRLAGVVQDMEEHLESPLSTNDLAARAGISVRQLERLMHDTVREAPARYYLKLRLQAARNHLFYGDMPIQDVAQACGFSSPSVLSRAFKDHFGVSPREFRRQFSSDRLERFRPELRQQFGLRRRARDPLPLRGGLGEHVAVGQFGRRRGNPLPCGRRWPRACAGRMRARLRTGTAAIAAAPHQSAPRTASPARGERARARYVAAIATAGSRRS